MIIHSLKSIFMIIEIINLINIQVDKYECLLARLNAFF